jgi:hypothetical protein
MGPSIAADAGNGNDLITNSAGTNPSARDLPEKPDRIEQRSLRCTASEYQQQFLIRTLQMGSRRGCGFWFSDTSDDPDKSTGGSRPVAS